jgi:hypothetical protein
MNEPNLPPQKTDNDSLQMENDSVDNDEQECNFCHDFPEHLICLTCQHVICITCAAREVLINQRSLTSFEFQSLICKFCKTSTDLLEDVQQVLINFLKEPGELEEKSDYEKEEPEPDHKNQISDFRLQNFKPTDKKSLRNKSIDCDPILEEDEDNYRECETERSNYLKNSLLFTKDNQNNLNPNDSPSNYFAPPTNAQNSDIVSYNENTNKEKFNEVFYGNESPLSSKYEDLYKISKNLIADIKRDSHTNQLRPSTDETKSKASRCEYKLKSSTKRNNLSSRNNKIENFTKANDVALSLLNIDSSREQDSKSLELSSYKSKDNSFQNYPVFEVEMNEKYLENSSSCHQPDKKSSFSPSMFKKLQNIPKTSNLKTNSPKINAEIRNERDFCKTLESQNQVNLKSLSKDKNSKQKKRRKKAFEFKTIGKFQIPSNVNHPRFQGNSEINDRTSITDSPNVNNKYSKNIDQNLFEDLRSSPSKLLKIKNSQPSKVINLFSPLNNHNDSEISHFPKINNAYFINKNTNLTNKSFNNKNASIATEERSSNDRGNLLCDFDTLYHLFSNMYTESQSTLGDFEFVCRYHNGKEIVYYDKKMAEPLCSSCLLDKKQHKSLLIENLMPFKEHISSIIQNGAMAINDIKLSLKIINNKKEDFEIRNQNFKNYASSNLLKIDKLLEGLMGQINEIRKDLRTNLDCFVSSLSENLLNDIGKIDHFTNEITNIYSEINSNPENSESIFNNFIHAFLYNHKEINKMIGETNQFCESLDMSAKFENSKSEVDVHYSSVLNQEINNIKTLCDKLILSSVSTDENSHFKSFHSKSNLSGKSVIKSKLILNSIATFQRDQIKTKTNEVYLKDLFVNPQSYHTLDRQSVEETQKKSKTIANLDDSSKISQLNFSKKLRPNLGQLSFNQRTNDIFEPLKKLIQKEKQPRHTTSFVNATLNNLNLSDLDNFEKYQSNHQNVNYSLANRHDNFASSSFHSNNFANKIETEKRMVEEKIKMYGISMIKDNSIGQDKNQITNSRTKNEYADSVNKLEKDDGWSRDQLPLISLVKNNTKKNKTPKDFTHSLDNNSVL